MVMGGRWLLVRVSATVMGTEVLASISISHVTTVSGDDFKS